MPDVIGPLRARSSSPARVTVRATVDRLVLAILYRPVVLLALYDMQKLKIVTDEMEDETAEESRRRVCFVLNLCGGASS